MRLKKDVERLATLEDGIRIYSFRFSWDDTYRVGVMAQDLPKAATRKEIEALVPLRRP